jgi:CelD/BcsL family acetyltransferase involved in cellulose biosynthesis
MAHQGGCEARHLVIHDSLAPLEAPWKQLAASDPNVFASWEWASLWCRHFGARHPLRILSVPGATGEPTVIVPLYLSTSRPFRVARFIGHGPADLLGAVSDPADRKLGPAALAEAHADGADWDIFIGECISGREEWVPDLPGVRLSRNAFPTIEIGGETWDDYLARGTRNFRQKIGWRTRRMFRNHDVVIRMTDDRDRLAADFATLVQLHQARWQSTGAFQGALEAFHRDFTTVAFDRGWLRLWIIELGGRPAAAALVFRYGGFDYFYQMGRDPAFDDDAVGFVLTAHVVRDAFESGVLEFRLLRGDEHYKRRFATSDPGLQTIAVPRTLVGRSAISVARIASRSRVRRAGQGPDAIVVP